MRFTEMSIFSKVIYKEAELPFIADVYSNWEQDEEAGVINIEAFGNIDGKCKYCYSSYILKKQFMYDNGDYEQMVELLKNPAGRTITIKLKYKKKRLADFELDIQSLAGKYNDERFLQMERIGWGLNDKSCRNY